MRCAVVVSVVALAGCTAKPETQARDVSLGLLKAMKAKDIDGVMSRLAVPFVNVTKTGRWYHADVLVSDEALRARTLSQWEKRDAPPLPADVLEVVPAAKVWETLDEKMPSDVRRQVAEALGPDGFVVVLGTDGKPVVRLMVGMKGGTAKVTGTLP